MHHPIILPYLSINSKSVSLLGMPGTNCFMKLQFDCIHSSDREKIMRKILNLDNDGVGGTKAASAQTLRHPLLRTGQLMYHLFCSKYAQNLGQRSEKRRSCFASFSSDGVIQPSHSRFCYYCY